jgi:hypothetical protein
MGEDHTPFDTEKNSLQYQHDILRGRYASAFAAEYKLKPHLDPGSLRSGYIKNKDGVYETHSNGLAKRYSVLSCRKGRVVWIMEGKDLEVFTVEVKSIAGETEQVYVYRLEELQLLLDRHLYEADRAHSINHFKNEFELLSRADLVKEYRQLKKAFENEEKDRMDLDFTRLSILEIGLSDKLEELIEEAFSEKGEVGRKVYPYVLRKSELAKPLFHVSKFFTASGITLIYKVKELTKKAVELDKKLTPSHPDYRIWIEQTADIASFIIDAFAARKKQEEKKLETPQLVQYAKKNASGHKE